MSLDPILDPLGQFFFQNRLNNILQIDIFLYIHSKFLICRQLIRNFHDGRGIHFQNLQYKILVQPQVLVDPIIHLDRKSVV